MAIVILLMLGSTNQMMRSKFQQGSYVGSVSSAAIRDLRANISAEAGARQTYEALINACNDEGTIKTLTHLLTREITHANMFMKALDQMGKLDDPFFGNIPPDDTVKLVFNLSQGEDARGPWNEEPDFEYVAQPAPAGGFPPPPVNPDDEGHGIALAKSGSKAKIKS